MNAIFLETASCSPTGRPHCTRSLDHSLEIFSASFPAAAQLAGSDSRPVFSVVRAIFSPWPSLPMRLVAGTTTSWNRVSPFSRPRRPMNSFRRSTVIPGALPLALFFPPPRFAPAPTLGNPGHHHQQIGDDPVGGPELDPVQHILRPVFRRHRRGVQPGRVGPDVGLGEQERADLTARTPRQVTLLLVIGAEQRQRLRHADRLVRGQQRRDGRRDRPGDDQRPVVVEVGQAQTAVLRRDFHAERPRRGQSLDHLIGDPGIPLDDGAVDRSLTELPQPGAELLAAAGGFLAGTGMRIDQAQLEVAQVQLLAEAGLLPVGLPGFLCYLARLLLADIPDTSCLVRTHSPFRSLDAHPQILPGSYPRVTRYCPRLSLAMAPAGQG